MSFLKRLGALEPAKHKECGTKVPIGDKIAGWLLVAMITYLVIVK